ncbi:Aldehyde/histidinol dehydrogenase [Ochromonadaceae sp. CCMP2298]|nr:Aldehyde/histidinol dehydrogenase [Ochromonadaceae sp. CCMP2298]
MELIADAVSKGAKVLNEGGGDLYGNLVRPAVVYPVTGDMRLWGEEQFGPVIPIAVYDDIEEVYRYIADTPYGQQASIFTTNTDSQAAALLDVLSTAVGRININTQCGRSPDSVPFSGRRSSALGENAYLYIHIHIYIYIFPPPPHAHTLTPLSIPRICIKPPLYYTVY